MPHQLNSLIHLIHLINSLIDPVQSEDVQETSSRPEETVVFCVIQNLATLRPQG